MSNRKMTMGVIVGNRGFFPDVLAKTGREEIIRVLEKAGMDCVVLSPEESKFGAVETHDEAKRCADLFARNRHRIDGIIVTLPNFGDERGAAEAIRRARLDVPVLVQASPDDAGAMTEQFRRDSFCGKISVCHNLRQSGIPYSLTAQHTVGLDTPEFGADLARFAAVCRVVRGLRDLRIGCIGARPAAFTTVRYSEKILEANHITVETVDLSDIYGRIGKLKDDDPGVIAKLAEIRRYVQTATTPLPALLKMAKLGFAVDDWMKSVDVEISAIQCWTSMQDHFGVMPCTVMSMMSNRLMSSACEADVCGTISMHALALAGEEASALLDWNNNYGTNPDKAVCFHCSNLPKSFFTEARMHHGEIFAGTVGIDNAHGTLAGRIKSGPMTFARISTDDVSGRMRGYVGEGSFTSDDLTTFGGVGVVEIPRLQELMQFICNNGFEHHVAANLTRVADAVEEATSRYLGWEMSRHRAA
ncbi:MAG: fucose isomerase [Ancalomicrobiaceae bacterium]|nr:fucose isomerase [Ancalomicrobiaceae bacterium]